MPTPLLPRSTEALSSSTLGSLPRKLQSVFCSRVGGASSGNHWDEGAEISARFDRISPPRRTNVPTSDRIFPSVAGPWRRDPEEVNTLACLAQNRNNSQKLKPKLFVSLYQQSLGQGRCIGCFGHGERSVFG